MSNSLTKEQHDTFRQKGFLLLRNFFPKEKAIAAGNWLKNQDQEKLAKTWTDQEPGVKLAVYQNIHQNQTPIAELASDKKLLQAAGELIDDEVYIWSSKVNVKAAWCGTVEYYHQDYAYWKGRGYDEVKMLTCMTCLDPHSPQNGGLHVIPESHQYGYIEHTDFININGLSKSMIAPEKLSELTKKHGLEAIVAEPGDVLFFHAGLIHGSSHNISPQSRMIILSQLNTVHNKPIEVKDKAKQYNLDRVTKEINEAQRKLDWFKAKYENQLKSDAPTFNSPIPDQEK